MASRPQAANSDSLKPNTIVLLHGFNSGPGQKAEEITAFLEDYSLTERYNLLAPQLSYEPHIAIRQIEEIIHKHMSGNVFVIGTSLGGFYANYFRAKFLRYENVIIHAINPSWNPSNSLQKNTDKELENYKTNQKWVFTNEYLTQLQAFETFIMANLTKYGGNHYSIHLANADEVLAFDNMLNFINNSKIPCCLYHYDTDHRFGEIRKVMELIIRE